MLILSKFAEKMFAWLLQYEAFSNHLQRLLQRLRERTFTNEALRMCTYSSLLDPFAEGPDSKL